MSLILHIDTSSPLCSVCIAENGKLIAEKSATEENLHAKDISAMITGVLKIATIPKESIKAVAINGGPGSYTGLRIGTSVAKGLCYGLDIPLICISSLQAMAAEMIETQPTTGAVYIPMIDARHGNIYMGIYDPNCQNLLNDTFVTMNEEFFNIYLRSYKMRYLGGNGVSRQGAEFGTVVENILSRACNMIALSFVRFKNKQFDHLAYYEPFYLKEYEVRTKIN